MGSNNVESLSVPADVAIIGGGMSLLHAVEDAKKAGMKVTACMGNDFLEWPMAACPFLVDPSLHAKFLCPNPKTWQLKDVEYVFDAVSEVVPSEKTIRFANHRDMTYRTLIVATGSRMPLIMPRPGDSLEQRMEQVRKASAAIAAANTVVVNGAGLIGLEMVGDIRAKHPSKRVVLLSRDGTVIGGTHPPEMQERVKAQLVKMNIEVKKGAVPKEFSDPVLEAGSVDLDAGEKLAFDVFIPAYAQGPNTAFLAGAGAAVLDEKGRIVANECLQCRAHPEIFGVNVTTVPLLGHPVASRVTAQAKTCVKNAKLLLEGKPPQPHKDKESPPPMERPLSIKIGHGRGGYMIWDESFVPAPAKCCCCLPCGGGYPCCPPPCCWCIASGCPTLCGSCCGPTESEGAAIFMLNFLLPKFMKPHGYLGAGQKPEQQKMT